MAVDTPQSIRECYQHAREVADDLITACKLMNIRTDGKQDTKGHGGNSGNGGGKKDAKGQPENKGNGKGGQQGGQQSNKGKAGGGQKQNAQGKKGPKDGCFICGGDHYKQDCTEEGNEPKPPSKPLLKGPAAKPPGQANQPGKANARRVAKAEAKDKPEELDVEEPITTRRSSANSAA